MHICLLHWPKLQKSHNKPSKSWKNIEDKCFKTGKAAWKKAASDVITKQELSEFSGERSTQLD